MHHRDRTLRWALAGLLAASAALVLAACGGGSSRDAATLLRESFGGTRKITSGQLAFNLTINPSGSKTLTGSISLSLTGPFQSAGTGKLPRSAFAVTTSALGNAASITITSTGNNGYVTFEGQSYRLPQRTFQTLESSFARLGSSPVSSGGSGVLGRLGIQPQHWLANPQVVGTETVAGVSTTHIHSGINVAAMLDDLNTVLTRAGLLGVSGAATFPRGISAGTPQKVAREVQNPSFDVWTGRADKTIRKLEIALTLRVAGTASTVLGGLRSAAVGLSLQYADLNQPQTITAPTALRPFSQFQTKLKALMQQIQSPIGRTLGGG